MILLKDRIDVKRDETGEIVEILTKGSTILTPYSCIVHEEENGDFYLTMEIDRAEENCKNEKIIVAPTPRNGPQMFRIYDIAPSITDSKTVCARHIFYDLLDNFLENVRPTNCTGNAAIQRLLAGLQYRCDPEFTGKSDINTVNTAYWEMLNPVEALIGEQENSFINRWGGVLDRNNHTFTIMQKDPNYTDYINITYGKDIENAGLHLDMSNVVTRIMPTGLKSDGQTLLKLPEKYVDSPLIDEYVYPKIRRIHYSDIRVGTNEGDYATEAEAIKALRERAAAEFEAGIDKPTVSGEVSVIDLAATQEYKDVRALETIVPFAHFRIWLDNKKQFCVEAEMQAYDYDALAQQYINITLGTKNIFVGESLLKQFEELKRQVESIGGRA